MLQSSVIPQSQWNTQELMKEWDCTETIYIVGPGPSMDTFSDTVVMPDSVVIALNRAFKFIDYDYHFFADVRFYNRYVDELNCSKAVIHPNTIGRLDFTREYIYHPVRELRNNGRDLICGCSVLIPAMHLALMAGPERILLYGIDLRRCAHFDGNTDRLKPDARFPSRLRIISMVRRLCDEYKEVEVYCQNPHSLLVKRGALKCL